MHYSSRSGRWSARALAAILLVACLGVVACGSDDDEGGGGGGGGENYKVTLIAGVKGDEFYITMNCGAQAEAEKLGVSLDFQGPDQFDASLQTPIVNAVTAKKPDAILIAPTDAKAMYAPIKQAADAGIKVVLVDTTLEQPDLAVSQIASDNLGGGKAAAKALAKEIGTYRFLDAVAAKGDAARFHPGLTVQRAIEIMAAHGLDALRYGFICHDAWDEEVTEHPALTDENGIETTPARTEKKPAGDLYSFRPDELMLFIGRGLDARLSALEAAVAGTA